jgi:hypothetical protein
MGKQRAACGKVIVNDRIGGIGDQWYSLLMMVEKDSLVRMWCFWMLERLRYRSVGSSAGWLACWRGRELVIVLLSFDGLCINAGIHYYGWKSGYHRSSVCH